MRALLVLVVVVLAGCADTTPTTPAQSAAVPGVTTSTAPSATESAGPGDPSAAPAASPPVALTMKEAAAAYLAVARKFNRGLRNVPSPKEATLKQRKREWERIANLDRRFADGLKAIAWPAEVQPEIDRLVRLTVVAERHERSVAGARNWDSLLARVGPANKAGTKSSDQAAIVRDLLGLSSN